MADVNNDGSDSAFARAFGNALREFVRETGMTQVDVAKRLGLKKKNGQPSKERVNQYLSASPPVPGANILFLACTKLRGFKFEYDGRQLNAKMARKTIVPPPPEQTAFRFNRQFNLTDKSGVVTEKGEFAMKVKRPSGGIEVALFVRGKKAS
jgi:transcriptional regulator with XRE-family HTH domain